MLKVSNMVNQIGETILDQEGSQRRKNSLPICIGLQLKSCYGIMLSNSFIKTNTPLRNQHENREEPFVTIMTINES